MKKLFALEVAIAPATYAARKIPATSRVLLKGSINAEEGHAPHRVRIRTVVSNTGVLTDRGFFIWIEE